MKCFQRNSNRKSFMLRNGRDKSIVGRAFHSLMILILILFCSVDSVPTIIDSIHAVCINDS